MSRFFVTPQAAQDLDEICTYLNQLPQRSGARIASELREAIRMLVQSPYQGVAHSELTRLSGQEMRSWRVGSYRIYYFLGGRVPEILAVLHAGRDHAAILRGRIQ